MAQINDLSSSYADDAAADAGFAAKGWLKSFGVEYYNTTFGQFKRWDATLNRWTIDTGGFNSLPGIQRTLFVEKSSVAYYTADGSQQFPFQTIQAALTAAAALGTPPSAANPVTICVYPGVYDESITAVAYVSLIGVGAKGSIIIAPTTTPAILLNIANNERAFFSNIRFQQVNSFAIVSALYVAGTVVEGPVFDSCQFIGNDNDAACVYINGYYRTGSFRQCVFEHSLKINTILRYGSNFSTPAPGLWGHYDCVFRGVVLAHGTARFVFQGGSIEVGGGGQVANYCILDTHQTLDTFVIVGMRMRNYSASGTRYCIGSAATTNQVFYVGNDLAVTSADGYDIGGSIGGYTITKGLIRNNRMARGYNSGVRIDAPEYKIGAPAITDFYKTLADFLTALGGMSGVLAHTVVLYTDCVISNTTLRRKVIFDGRGIHSISVAGGGALFGLGAGADVTFQRITLTGKLSLSNAGVVLRLLEGTKLYGGIVTNANTGQQVVLRHTQVFGTAAVPIPIELGHTSNYLRMVDSYLKSSTTYVIYDASATGVSDCKWRGCTLVADVFGTLGISAAQTPHACAAHNRYEHDPWVPTALTTWTNDVASAQRMESYDANNDFDEDV